MRSKDIGGFVRHVCSVHRLAGPLPRRAAVTVDYSRLPPRNTNITAIRSVTSSAAARTQRSTPVVDGTPVGSTRVRQDTASEETRTLALKIQDLVSLELFPCHVDVLGEHRRGSGLFPPSSSLPSSSPALVLAIVDSSDAAFERIPTEPMDTGRSKAQEARIKQLLVSSHLAISRGEDLFLPSSDTKLELHYIPEACRGAAQLFLTGSRSYIDFLQLLAREGYGLTLDKHGLWRRKNIGDVRAEEEEALRRRRTTRGQGQGQDQAQTPPGITIREIDEEETASRPAELVLKTETAGEQRMRQMRKEMGLPEGLDLSLSLDDGPTVAAQKTDVNGTSGAVGEGEAEEWERIQVGKGSEADILDVLGLVWLPPELRFVRDPSQSTDQEGKKEDKE